MTRHEALSAQSGDSDGTLRVLVVNADAAFIGLIGEWLVTRTCRVNGEPTENDAAQVDCDLLVVDLPFPRQGGAELLRRVAARHPGVPVLVLSSGFFPGVGESGAVAHAFGVASVLPKPLTREALVTAVDKVLARTG